MHHVNRRLAFVYKSLHRRRKFRHRIFKIERHRARLARNGHAFLAVQIRKDLFKKVRASHRRRHQQKARLRKGQQRNLPSNAAFPVGIIMELVHHDVLNIQFRPFAERTVFQNFRSAAKDRSLHIHRPSKGPHFPGRILYKAPSIFHSQAP